MKYKNVIKLRLPEIQLLAVVPTQLKFNIAKDHDEPTILLFETLFCMWECFNMGLLGANAGFNANNIFK
jgi:hypothetical protein